DRVVRADRHAFAGRCRPSDVCIHSHHCRSDESCKSSHRMDDTEPQVSNLPAETEAIAAALARRLRAGDVVTVSGELGTGKTTFVRGACRALGIEVPVTSPTFTIGHRYSGNPDVSHLDLYRFQGFSPAEWGDVEPYFEDAICFVEWPEAAAGALPPVRVSIRLSHVDRERRTIELSSDEPQLLAGVSGDADARL